MKQHFAANGVTGAAAVAMAAITLLNHTVLKADPIGTDAALMIVTGFAALARFAQGWLRWKGYLPPVALAVMLGLGASTSACATVSDGAVQKAAILTSLQVAETTANVIYDECGNVKPNGPCVGTSVISTSLKNQMKGILQRAVDTLRVSLAALGVAQADSIDEALAEAARLIGLVRDAFQNAKRAGVPAAAGGAA